MDSIIVGVMSFLGGALTLLTPVIKLTSTITKLNLAVEGLTGSLKTTTKKNDKDHEVFYDRIGDLESDMTEVQTKVKLYHDKK